jgi:EEF1A N-terminal glycine/lysine methyltransferase
MKYVKMNKQRELVASDTSGYDVVIMSDLLHFDACHGVLISSLTRLLSKTSGARAYIAAGSYTRGEVCEKFIRMARDAGINMEERERMGSGEWEGRMNVKGGGLDREQLGLRKRGCRMWTCQWDDTRIPAN